MFTSHLEIRQMEVPRGFMWAVGILSLSYLLVELLYIPFGRMGADEFWFGHHIYEYTKKIPYRDFPPYKTVLGYYLLSIPMYFAHTVLTPLFQIKEEIALINTVLISVTAIWATRFFHYKAVILTLLIIISNQLFLVYSVDLRVDMLTSWLGLISLLLILSNRTLAAGVVLALSFLVSQKALWFFAASNMAFACYWLFAARQWQTVRTAFNFNLAILISVSLYIVFWSILSTPSSVLHSLFYEAYTQSKITWYSKIYYNCWMTIMRNGPLLVLLWPLTWLSLFTPSSDKTKKQRIFIAAYSSVMMLFILTYQQAFPYNMVFALPVFFVLYADFFSFLLKIFNQNILAHLNEKVVFWFTSLCSIAMLGVNCILNLPIAYFAIAAIPICLGLYIRQRPHPLSTLPTIIWGLILCSGILYPLTRFSVLIPSLSGHYQQEMIITMNKLLQNGDGYVGGIPFLYNKNQPVPGLKNLISPAVSYLYKPNPELLPVLIPSLYLEPRTMQQVLTDLNNMQVKLYVNNYRMLILPKNIKKFLRAEYQYYGNSIYLYAPKISAGHHTKRIKFSGDYQLQTTAQIKIDNRVVKPNTIITLDAGTHDFKSKSEFRLKLKPSNSEAKSLQQQDLWYETTANILI